MNRIISISLAVITLSFGLLGMTGKASAQWNVGLNVGYSNYYGSYYPYVDYSNYNLQYPSYGTFDPYNYGYNYTHGYAQPTIAQPAYGYSVYNQPVPNYYYQQPYYYYAPSYNNNYNHHNGYQNGYYGNCGYCGNGCGC